MFKSKGASRSFKSNKPPSKDKMNSSRINLLWAIRNAGETDYGSIGSMSMPSLVVTSVALFVKLGMVEHTRDDNFQITSQGEEYLDGLRMMPSL